MRFALVTFALLLAACGADGPPRYQEREPAQRGVTMSGEAQIGMMVDL